MLRMQLIRRLRICLPLISLIGGCGRTESSRSATQVSTPELAPTKLAGFVALGDSIVAGYGVPKAAGEVSLFHAYLENLYQVDIALKDLATPGANSASIISKQLSAATTFINDYTESGGVVVVNGGGNDLLAFANSSTYSSTCLKGDLVACFGAVGNILDSTEKNLDTLLSSLRTAAGPTNPILILSYANSKQAPGCASAFEVSLYQGALEGVAGTALSRGLNNRIRELATQYNAKLVELDVILNPSAGQTISGDCIHPNAEGYRLIYAEMIRVLNAP